MQLLEPNAPDSLIHWGLLNAIFEQKEYFENYAMDPIAAKMLAADPALKQAFEEEAEGPGVCFQPARRGFSFFLSDLPILTRR